MPSNMVILGSVNGTIDVEDGHNMTLTCKVKSGLPLEKLAWKHGNKILANGGPGTVSITLAQKRYRHLSNLTCVANNSKTSELSEHVRVNIKWKPDVSVYIYPNESVQEGENVTFSCSVHSNPPTSSVSLLYENGNIKTLSSFGPNMWILQMIDINRTENGNYTCIANNSIGQSSNSIFVDVQYPPVVNILQSTTANLINLTCVPHGNPSKYFFETWEHQSLFGEHVRFITGYDNGTLILKTDIESNYKHQLSGMYTCNVTNHVKERMGTLYQSKRIIVNYKGEAVFLKRNEQKHFVHYGDSIKVQIYAYSNPRLINVSLYELDEIRTNNVEIWFEEQSGISDVSFEKSIKIQGYVINVNFGYVNVSSFRMYILAATNIEGVSNYSFNLCSANVPERPTNIKIYHEANNIKIAWRRNFNGGYPQTFKVEIRSTLTQQWEHINITDKNLTDNFYIFEDLQPDHLYQIKISAFNVIGSSNSSEIIEIKTQYTAKHKILMFVLPGLVVISICVGLASAIHYSRKSGWRLRCHKMRKDSCDQSSFEQGENVAMNNIYDLEGGNEETIRHGRKRIKLLGCEFQVTAIPSSDLYPWSRRQNHLFRGSVLH